jgi:hypothetical protein
MLGEYPVLVNGQETGTLRVSKEGIMTLFEARCRDPGELLRLSVYGEHEAYLGVMMPDGKGEACLRKRLSRTSLAGFPESIRFAGPAGMGDARVTEEPNQMQTDEKMQTQPPEEPAAEPASHEPTESRAQIIWRHGAGGALVGTDADRRYLAIPIKAGVLPLGGDFERKTIADTEYAVFVIRSTT